jgi:predicted DNA-binding transcriptional regulator AlpA
MSDAASTAATHNVMSRLGICRGRTLSSNPFKPPAGRWRCGKCHVSTLVGEASEVTMRSTSMNDLHLSPLLTAKEAAVRLKVSLSWLAKARMRGDGPPYICIGRSIRYTEAATAQWMKSRQRLSTSKQCW